VEAKPVSELAAGEITMIAGGIPYIGDGGTAVSASVAYPNGVVVDGAGNVLIADTSNSRIRPVKAVAAPLSASLGLPPDNSFAARAPSVLEPTSAGPERPRHGAPGRPAHWRSPRRPA
jgi:hypothetical protein